MTAACPAHIAEFDQGPEDIAERAFVQLRDARQRLQRDLAVQTELFQNRKNPADHLYHSEYSFRFESKQE